MIDVSNITITRSQLLSTKQQLELTQQGYELLDKKRIALMQKIIELQDLVVEEARDLQQLTNKAQMNLARAEAFVGEGRVKSASLGNEYENPIEVEHNIVMGVQVPRIHSSPSRDKRAAQAASFNSTSTMIEEAGSAFTKNVDGIIRLADGEIQLATLMKEILHNTRRLKALELIVIPRLKAEVAYIRDELDERERSDHFRLKLAKDIIEQRNKRAQQRRAANFAE
ncbi:MAG: V-type ATP synthase subunit D [Chloroflexi bacterium]|jgi:V/A-type H+-transporting ATPase subunit D|nr:V-type ATP synthase subunit D [Chloroflexota bacterium]